MSAPCGFLNVAKPSGITSRDVVNRVQRLVRPAKAGHAGTLDPLASGVLVVAVGQATRLIEYVQRMPKRYAGTFLLGRHSPTEDTQGDVELLSDPPIPERAQIEAVAEGFVGQIEQRPPAFSALKVGGRRAYDLARAGQTVDLAPRPVTIYRLRVTGYAYPELKLEIECSGGTYVRSLGRDIAHCLGTAAVMSGLVRRAVGSFELEGAVNADELESHSLAERLLPLECAAADLPRVALTPDEAARVAHGLPIPRDRLPGGSEFAGYDELGRLVSILKAIGPNELRADRNFSGPS